MSVILDALHKARRDGAAPAQTSEGGIDTRAVDGYPRSARPKKRRTGLVVLVVLACMGLTFVLCVGGLYLLALQLGAIPRGWPATGWSIRLPEKPSVATPDGSRVIQQGEVVELPALAAADASAGGTPATPAAAVGQMPTPAPISQVAAIVAASPAAPSGSPMQPAAPASASELPITVQAAAAASALPPPSAPPPSAPPPAAAFTPVAVVSPAAPAITVGTILCDETGCTAALNGRTVRVGDAYNEYTVMAITERQVTLQRAGEAPLILRPRF